MYGQVISLGHPAFPEGCNDPETKFLMVLARVKEVPEVSSTKKTLNVIDGERMCRIVPEPYGKPVEIGGSPITVSLSAYIPNPDAPKPEPTLSERQRSILREGSAAAADASFAASANNPLMQQVASILAQQMTGMR